MALLHSTCALLSFTSLYYTLSVLYLALRDSTTLYKPWLYWALLHSTIPLLSSTGLYYTLQLLYLALLHPTMALVGST